MSGLFIFLVIFLAVVCMVLAISKFNQHPFIVLTVIAIAVGLVCGIPTEEVINTVKSGFGNILASIGIVILAGTIIGTEKVIHILEVELEDNVKAHILQPDGSYEKEDKRGKVLVNSQEQFCREAILMAKESADQEDPARSRVFKPVMSSN